MPRGRATPPPGAEERGTGLLFRLHFTEFTVAVKYVNKSSEKHWGLGHKDCLTGKESSYFPCCDGGVVVPQCLKMSRYLSTAALLLVSALHRSQSSPQGWMEAGQ